MRPSVNAQFSDSFECKDSSLDLCVLLSVNTFCTQNIKSLEQKNRILNTAYVYDLKYRQTGITEKFYPFLFLSSFVFLLGS